jgi:hypothetical protein
MNELAEFENTGVVETFDNFRAEPACLARDEL